MALKFKKKKMGLLLTAVLPQEGVFYAGEKFSCILRFTHMPSNHDDKNESHGISAAILKDRKSQDGVSGGTVGRRKSSKRPSLSQTNSFTPDFEGGEKKGRIQNIHSKESSDKPVNGSKTSSIPRPARSDSLDKASPGLFPLDIVRSLAGSFFSTLAGTPTTQSTQGSDGGQTHSNARNTRNTSYSKPERRRMASNGDIVPTEGSSMPKSYSQSSFGTSNASLTVELPDLRRSSSAASTLATPSRIDILPSDKQAEIGESVMNLRTFAELLDESKAVVAASRLAGASAMDSNNKEKLFLTKTVPEDDSLQKLQRRSSVVGSSSHSPERRSEYEQTGSPIEETSNDLDEKHRAVAIPARSASLLTQIQTSDKKFGDRPSLVEGLKPYIQPCDIAWAFAQMTGQFSVDSNFVKTSALESLKKKVMYHPPGTSAGSHGGGGSLHLPSAIDQNPTNNVSGGRISRNEISPLPLYSTPPSILFCDEQLAVDETKSYLYEIMLPFALPPTHRGRVIRFFYKLMIGVQLGTGPSSQTQIISIPFRIFNRTNRKMKIKPISYYHQNHQVSKLTSGVWIS